MLPDRPSPLHLPLDGQISAPAFAPPSAAPVPRELMFAAFLLFLVGIAAFFAFR
jgi:hypothetical protein